MLGCGASIQSAPGTDSDVDHSLRRGEAYGLYRPRRSSFVLSFLGHALAIALLLASGRFVAAPRHEIRQQVIGIVTEVWGWMKRPSQQFRSGSLTLAARVEFQWPCRWMLKSTSILIGVSSRVLPFVRLAFLQTAGDPESQWQTRC